jgi:hypothetical protein
MHIVQPCSELKALMSVHNALSTAFITAWNPFSQNLLAKENKARQDERKASAQKARTDLYRWHRQTLQQERPREVSVLVLGLDLEAAKSLAWYYEQHAFVWAVGDGLPQLIAL